MKTSNKTQTAEKQNHKQFPTEQLCSSTLLRKHFKQPAQSNHSTAKSRRTRQWLKVIEFAVVGFATWLNPNAGFLIFLLKLCFQILKQLQDKPEH